MRGWEDTIKMDLLELELGAWIGQNRLRIGTDGGLF
jgi:hypothetical protein